ARDRRCPPLPRPDPARARSLRVTYLRMTRARERAARSARSAPRIALVLASRFAYVLRDAESDRFTGCVIDFFRPGHARRRPPDRRATDQPVPADHRDHLRRDRVPRW